QRHTAAPRRDAGIGQQIRYRELPRRSLARGERIHGSKEYLSRARVKRECRRRPSSFVRPLPPVGITIPVAGPSIRYDENLGSARSAGTIVVVAFAALARALVEKVIDLSRRLCTNPGHFGEVSWRRALDGLESSEMVEQRALADRADPRDLL